MKAIERIMLELAVVSALALALMITVNVLGRGLLGWTLPDVVIIVRELMIPTIMLPLAAATALLISVLPTPAGPSTRSGLPRASAR